MADEQRLHGWLESFPADDVEQEIEDLLAEIDRLKAQVRRRREVLKIWRSMNPTGDGEQRIEAARRTVRSTRTKGRDG
jgi:cell division septum initiation protein DivIVA